MYEAQKNLVTHIEASNLFNNDDVDNYSGEITAKGVHRKRTTYPAALILLKDGAPDKSNNPIRFDILVISESKVFDKDTNKINNTKVASDLLNYLQKHHTYGDDNFDFEIDEDSLRSRTIYPDERFIISIITCEVEPLL